MKRMLMVASVPSMIGQFNMSNIRILQEMGYEVDVACNFADRSVWSEERIEQFQAELDQKGIGRYQVDFSRSMSELSFHVKSYQQLKKILVKERYEFLHCHTPIAGALARIAGHAAKTKVIYTAHGFHFYKGAPLKNWLLYYPVERFLSRWTDVLITINQEDYKRANGFHAKRVERIPGVGFDTLKFTNCKVSKEIKRKELNIPENAFLIVSVGELNKNKNQQIIIHALSQLKNNKIYYLIVGEGCLEKKLKKLSKDLGMCEQIRFLGYRQDIPEICKAADAFVHPAIREGLGIAVLEGMAAGLPVIVSNAGGIKDYAETGKTGYCVSSNDLKGFVAAINKMYHEPEFRMKCAKYNVECVKKYDIEQTNMIMKKIYSGYL